MIPIDGYTLGVTARNPNDPESRYTSVREHGLSVGIHTCTGTDEKRNMELILRNGSDADFTGVVHVELCVNDSDPQFFMPAFMYNRNRGNVAPYRNRSGGIALYPRLSRDPAAAPYSDFWMVRADRLSHPVTGMVCGKILYGLSVGPLSNEGSIFNGFSCRLGTPESRIGFSLGYENAPWLYVDLTTLEKNTFGCITVKSGETRTVPFTVHTFHADDERALNRLIRAVYRQFHQAPRTGPAVPDAIRDIAGAIGTDGYVEACKTYSTRVFLKEGKQYQEPLASISWTGGVEVAAPVLQAAARLNDREMRLQALTVIQNVVDHAMNPRSNLPFDAYNDRHWYTEGWWDGHLSQSGHSAYLAGQALSYLLAGYETEKNFFGTEHPDWLEFVRRCLDHIETTKDADGEVPYLWSAETGEGLDYDSFAGCWCVAAAVQYDRIVSGSGLLASAERSMHHYYSKFVRRMECYGTPIDTLKAVDSEGILSFIKASRLLHEMTRKKIYLEMLADGLEYEFTFKFCWNPPIQYEPLKRIGWSSCGGSVTSTCNPHIHPMSSSVYDEIRYCFRETGDAYFGRRLEDTLGWSLQTYSSFDGEYDFGKKGWMSERFCHSEGLLIESYENGDPCSTWRCFLPWGASNILQGLCSVPENEE